MVEQSQKTPAVPAVSFEQALTMLEQIVHELEEGRLGLTASLAHYEEGVNLLRQCHALLQQAERKIELVTGMDTAGNPVTEPFDDQATYSGPTAQSPKTRRGRVQKKSFSQSTDEQESSDESFGPGIDEPGSLF